jgi:integrase
MRAGELAALDVGDVLNGGTIRREFRLGTEDTKYCRARTIFLESPKAINAVLAYLRARNPDLSFNGTELLFVGPRRNRRDGSFRLSANTVVQTFARLYERASSARVPTRGGGGS